MSREIRFFHTNAACKLYGQPLFSQLFIYHLGRLVLRVLKFKNVFQMLENNVCFPPFCAGFGAQKKLSFANVAAHVHM